MQSQSAYEDTLTREPNTGAGRKEVITNVHADDLKEVANSFFMDGATSVTRERANNGTFVVIAKFDGD